MAENNFDHWQPREATISLREALEWIPILDYHYDSNRFDEAVPAVAGGVLLIGRVVFTRLVKKYGRQKATKMAKEGKFGKTLKKLVDSKKLAAAQANVRKIKRKAADIAHARKVIGDIKAEMDAKAKKRNDKKATSAQTKNPQTKNPQTKSPNAKNNDNSLQKRYSPQEIRAAVALYKRGNITYKSAAEKAGVSRSTLVKWVRDSGGSGQPTKSKTSTSMAKNNTRARRAKNESLLDPIGTASALQTINAFLGQGGQLAAAQLYAAKEALNACNEPALRQLWKALRGTDKTYNYLVDKSTVAIFSKYTAKLPQVSMGKKKMIEAVVTALENIARERGISLEPPKRAGTRIPYPKLESLMECLTEEERTQLKRAQLDEDFIQLTASLITFFTQTSSSIAQQLDFVVEMLNYTNEGGLKEMWPKIKKSVTMSKQFQKRMRENKKTGKTLKERIIDALIHDAKSRDAKALKAESLDSDMNSKSRKFFESAFPSEQESRPHWRPGFLNEESTCSYCGKKLKYDKNGKVNHNCRTSEEEDGGPVGTFAAAKSSGKNESLNEGRPVSVIAAEIEREWENVNFAARPYLDAMHDLNSVNDNYMFDSGRGVVLRFLGNARKWTGPKAKEIKAELKKLLNEGLSEEEDGGPIRPFTDGGPKSRKDYCDSCGHKVFGSGAFCSGCGKKLKVASHQSGTLSRTASGQVPVRKYVGPKNSN